MTAECQFCFTFARGDDLISHRGIAICKSCWPQVLATVNAASVASGNSEVLVPEDEWKQYMQAGRTLRVQRQSG